MAASSWSSCWWWRRHSTWPGARAVAGSWRHLLPSSPWQQPWSPYHRLVSGDRTMLLDTMKISIAAEPFDSTDARKLITALDAHLASRYAPEQRFGPNL